MQQVRVIFGIPLISRAASADWALTTQLLGRTLRSVLGQTDPDFLVLVCGNDRPELAELSDPRVEFLRAELPIPQAREEKMRDKALKCIRLAQRVREHGGAYLMFLDADDLVSQRVVAWTRAHGGHGFLAETGYGLDTASQRIYRVPGLVPKPFDQVCGSCAMIRFEATDLPGAVPEDYPGIYLYHFTGHKSIRRVSQSLNRPLAPFPFPAVTYVLNHGANYTGAGMLAKAGNPLRELARKLKRLYYMVPPWRMRAVLAEFGLGEGMS